MKSFFKKILSVQKSSTETSLEFGKRGEQAALFEYDKMGFTLVARNSYNKKGLRLGEIDLIVRNKTTIVFVEVKARKSESGKFGSAAESVNFSKQKKLLKAVKLFLATKPAFLTLVPRIDVAVVNPDNLDKSRFSVKIIENSVEDWS